ncbi:hypothetical protein KAZ66_02080 [Candidatus Woesebacteria bacterium]|nr:hypothetical protein [Candidatus Woesebacteria bacterium]
MNNLDRKKIIALLQDKKVQNYGFLIVFFILFSFFIIFAIRPNLLTAFNLQKELQDLKLQNREFESKIQKIVAYQTLLENYRDDIPLLDQAVPPSPELAKVIEDVRQSATDSGVFIQTLKVESVDYKAKSSGDKLQVFSISTDALASTTSLRQFFDLLLNQRRLKSLDIIDLSKGDFTSSETNDINIYKINLIISSNYL